MDRQIVAAMNLRDTDVLCEMQKKKKNSLDEQI